MQNIMKTMASLSEQLGIEVKDCGKGHYQILGKILVNYYPLSKSRTAYIAKTNKGLKDVSPVKAFEMSQEVPTGLDPTPRKKSGYTKIKKALYKKTKNCYWCKSKLTCAEATVDHVVPLSKGGLDHHTNRVLCCFDCNQKRGNKMPEIYQCKEL